MKNVLLGAALISVLALSACDRNPTVVNVPTPVAVPVPVPGPAGATGATGATGSAGTGTTVIVTPPAPAASN